MRMRKTSTATLVFFLVAGLTFSACDVGGDDEYEFSDWDQDGDELLDENEFYRAYAGVKFHERWDTDQDMFIDEEEWEQGVANYWAPYDIGEYGAFAAWDPDIHGRIPEQQFRERIVEFYDRNDDGYLDQVEYQAWEGDFAEQE